MRMCHWGFLSKMVAMAMWGRKNVYQNKCMFLKLKKWLVLKLFCNEEILFECGDGVYLAGRVNLVDYFVLTFCELCVYIKCTLYKEKHLLKNKNILCQLFFDILTQDFQ